MSGYFVNQGQGQGQVVWKLYKFFFTAFVLCSLRLLNSKQKVQQCKQKASPQSYKTQIKILAYPEFA